MGINNLHKFLKKHCENVYKETHISKYAFKKIAIDTSLYMYKYKACFGDGWLTAFINLVATLRKNNIHCIFIYDNGCPPEKIQEREERNAHKEKLEDKAGEIERDIDLFYQTNEITPLLKSISQKDTPDKVKRLLSGNKFNITDIEKYLKKVKSQIIYVSENDFKITRDLFDILGIPYANAVLEAEKTCAQLCYEGKVDAVLSEDTDVLAYNTPVFLTKFNSSSDTCCEINIKEILETIDMTYQQFRDLCIMCGTDYNKNIFRVGPEKAYDCLIQYGSIEGIKENHSEVDITVLKHIRVRELFSFTDECNIEVKYCKEPNYEKLEEFVFKNNCRVKMERLRESFSPSKVIFED